MKENSKNFKLTEIGMIPKEWELTRLDALLSLEYGKALPDRERTGRRYPVIGSSGIVGYHYQSKVIGPGIIIGRKGSIGAITLIKEDFWPIDTTYYVKTLVKNIDLKWLFYALVKLNLPKLNLSDVVPGLKRELVYSLKLSLPPLPEQQKIAEILSTVDQVIEKVDEAIKKTQKLKKGMMQELLTKGIGHKEFKDTEIGRIPKGWEIYKIKNIGNIITGKTPSTKNKVYWNGNIPFITPADIKQNKYINNTKRNVSNEGVRRIGYILPKEAVVVVCIGSTIGKIGITSKESVTNQQNNSIVCKKKINPHYVYYALLLRNKILKSFSGIAAVPIINKTLFGNLEITIPPLPEQQKIAEILSTVDSRLKMLRKRKGKLERVKKGLMKDLLTGRKRVKLDS